MMQKLQKLVLVGALVYGIYWLLGHHILLFGGKNIEILPKKDYNFNNTFFSIQDEKEIRYLKLENILRDNPDLRAAGLGDILVERGLVTQEQLREAEDKADYGE